MSVNLNWITSPEPLHITPFQRFLRDFEWADTAFGPMDQWCNELRQCVRFMALDDQPTIIYWGPSRAIIYNEAHVHMIGNKHPHIMGKNASDVFPEFWPYFEGVLQEQALTGKTASGEASRLLMERHGFLEETYFDWKLVPIVGDDGSFLGGYGTPSDKTKTIINERRALCVQDLASRISTAGSFDDVWKSAILSLSGNDRDIPFALLYANDGLPKVGKPTATFSLVGSFGVPKGHVLQDTSIDLDNGTTGFAPATREAIEQGQPLSILADDPNICDYLQGIEWQGSGSPCKQFIVVPITAGTKTSVIMVIGTNPHRMYNSYYQDFTRLLSDVLAVQVSKLRLSEELNYRAAVASKATRDFEQSEIRFSRLASRSTVCIAVTDLKGQVLYANEAWTKFSNVSLDQKRSFNWRESIFEEDLPLVDEWWYKVTVLKQSGTFQFRSKTPFKHGKMQSPYRTALCACYADLDEQGGVETVMNLVVDISEQKWIEGQLLERTKELESSEVRYRTLADLSPLGIVSTDRYGYIQFGNDAWHDFYGFKKGQVKDPQPWLPYVCAEHLDKTKQYFKDLQTKKGPLTVELRLNRKFTMVEGDELLESSIWVLATGVQEYSADGQIDHIDFWVTDISAQKMAAKMMSDKMEEAIRNRTQQERFIDMISHEIRNPLSAVLHCGEEIIDAIKKCLKQSNGTLAEEAPVPASEDAILSDALDAANTIMYCVQHQKQIVDDVLTLSKLDSDLLVVSPVPIRIDDLMRSAARIFDAEVRMSDIVLNLREHESLAHHGVEWLLLDPNRFLQIVINLLTNAIKFTRGCNERRIEVITSVYTEPPRNLANIDFVPRKFSPLERRGSYVQISNADEANQLYLLVSVSDTGKGLTAQEKGLLFKRFAQGSPKTSVEYGGSGLGLFISRQITEMLGGDIGVGNSPSGGCTFAFYVATSRIEPPSSAILARRRPSLPPRPNSAPVPLDPSQETRKLVPEVPSVAKRTRAVPSSTRRVLVVEDNLVNQRVLCKQLRNRGFEVEASNHGREALMALEIANMKEKGYFDVILCDIEMPVMDGIECVKEIRSRELGGDLPNHIPIIGVTANVRSKHVDAAIEAGMDGVTTKPYRIDDLILHIDRLCANTALIA